MTITKLKLLITFLKKQEFIVQNPKNCIIFIY